MLLLLIPRSRAWRTLEPQPRDRPAKGSAERCGDWGGQSLLEIRRKYALVGAHATYEPLIERRFRKEGGDTRSDEGRDEGRVARRLDETRSETQWSDVGQNQWFFLDRRD